MKDFIIGLCETLERRTGYDYAYLYMLFMDTVAKEDNTESALIDFIVKTLDESWCYTPAESVHLFT